MARIPTLDNVTPSLNVPKNEISPTAVGATELAMAKMGGAVADFSLELVKKRTRQEAFEYSSNKKEQYLQGYNNLKRKLATFENIDGAGELIDPNNNRTGLNYAQALDKFSQEFKQQALKEAPSNMSRELFDRTISPLMTAHLIQDEKILRGYKRASSKHFLDKRAIDKADLLLRLPLVDAKNGKINDLQTSASNLIKDFENLIFEDGLAKLEFISDPKDVLSNTEVQKAFKDGAKKIGNIYFDRALTSNDALEIRKAIDVVSGVGTPNQNIAVGLSPRERSTMKVRLEQALKRFGDKEEVALSETSSSITKSLATGINFDLGRGYDLNNVDDQINSFKSQIVNSSIDPSKKLKLLSPVIAARVNYSANVEKFSAPESEWEKIDMRAASEIETTFKDLQRFDPRFKPLLKDKAFLESARAQILNNGRIFNSNMRHLKEQNPTKFVDVIAPDVKASMAPQLNSILLGKTRPNPTKIRSSIRSYMDQMNKNGIPWFKQDIPGEKFTKDFYSVISQTKDPVAIEETMNRFNEGFSDLTEAIALNMKNIDNNKDFNNLVSITTTFTDRRDRRSFIDSYVNREDNRLQAANILGKEKEDVKTSIEDNISKLSSDLIGALAKGQGIQSGNSKVITSIVEMVRNESYKSLANKRFDNEKDATNDAFSKINKKYIVRDAMVLPRSKYKDLAVKGFVKAYKNKPDNIFAKMKEEGLTLDLSAAIANFKAQTGIKRSQKEATEAIKTQIEDSGYMDNFGDGVVFKYKGIGGRDVILHGKDAKGNIIPFVLGPDQINTDHRSIQELK